MKPPPFEYYRATTVEEAIALLSRYGPDARCWPAAKVCCR